VILFIFKQSLESKKSKYYFSIEHTVLYSTVILYNNIISEQKKVETPQKKQIILFWFFTRRKVKVSTTFFWVDKLFTHEGNTEEGHNGYVVFKRNILGLAGRQAPSHSFLQQASGQIFNDDMYCFFSFSDKKNLYGLHG
jgi:hypothetical protein